MAGEIVRIPHVKLMDGETVAKHLDLRHPTTHPETRRGVRNRQVHAMAHNPRVDRNSEFLDHVHFIPDDLEYNCHHPDYFANHVRVRELRGSPEEYKCVVCGIQAHDWSWLSKEFTDPYNPWSYAPMCRRCNLMYDDDPKEHSARGYKGARKRWG
jgi:hypothetical protein